MSRDVKRKKTSSPNFTSHLLHFCLLCAYRLCVFLFHCLCLQISQTFHIACLYLTIALVCNTLLLYACGFEIMVFVSAYVILHSLHLLHLHLCCSLFAFFAPLRIGLSHPAFTSHCCHACSLSYAYNNVNLGESTLRVNHFSPKKVIIMSIIIHNKLIS